MPATPIFHIGVLVRDVEAAKARLGELLGITFAETLTFPVTFDHAGQRSTHDVMSSFSNEGPPFVELVESQDEGPLSRSFDEGLHHVGAWASSLEDRLEQLSALGAPPEYRAFRASGLQSGVFLAPEEAHGTRLELSPHQPDLRGYTSRLPGAGQ